MQTKKVPSLFKGLVLLGLIASLALTVESVDTAGRIVGGKDVAIEEANYMVQILHTSMGLLDCGGTLVKRDYENDEYDAEYVVTAAHCFDSYAESDLTVVSAATYLHVNEHRGRNPNAKVAQVAKFWKHPNYNPKTLDYDVGVLKLKAPFTKGVRTQAVKMCQEPLKGGDRIFVTGWGKLFHESPIISVELQGVNVPVLSQDKCTQLHEGSDSKISDRMVCAGSMNGQDSCNGDSGGPAIKIENDQRVLCGIVSWGVGCAENNYPGVYISVPVVRDFIDQCMNEMI